jgi:hypothetical protein
MLVVIKNVDKGSDLQFASCQAILTMCAQMTVVSFRKLTQDWFH